MFEAAGFGAAAAGTSAAEGRGWVGSRTGCGSTWRAASWGLVASLLGVIVTRRVLGRIRCGRCLDLEL